MGLNFKLDIGLTSCHGKPVVHRYRANITDAKTSISDMVNNVLKARDNQFALAA